MKAKVVMACIAASTMLLVGCGNNGNEADNSSAVNNTENSTEVNDNNGESAGNETTGGQTEEGGAVEGIDTSINAAITPDDLGVTFFGSGLELSQNIDSSKVAKDPISVGIDGSITINNVNYVMIYNPLVYSENYSEGTVNPNYLYTGDFSSEVVLPGSKADLGEENDYFGATMSPAQFLGMIQEAPELVRDGVKAGMDPVHYEGESFEFYHRDTDMVTRIKSEFECVYEGEYCYVWSLDGCVSKKDATEFGESFDDDIFEQEIETFGTARFTENGGKVNIIFRPLPGNLGGYFDPYDLFSKAEFGAYGPDAYACNSDHAIIFINSNLIESNFDEAKVTIAHEFQHLICQTDIFFYSETPQMETWLNESMSAYAEELIFPGAGVDISGKNQWFCISDLYRNGQSLYNFYNDMDDIGCYGAVYLFAKYFDFLALEDGPLNLHNYWRESYSADVTAAEAIYNITPDKNQDIINQSYVYPDTLSDEFDSEYDEWMSKVTLDFYIATADAEFCNLEMYEKEMHLLYLYNSLDPAEIEGGGRIMVATKNGSFTIPEDSDTNLVYIGFDQDFNVVSGFVAY